MTYNVLIGTLNPTHPLPYPLPWSDVRVMQQVLSVCMYVSIWFCTTANYCYYFWLF